MKLYLYIMDVKTGEIYHDLSKQDMQYCINRISFALQKLQLQESVKVDIRDEQGYVICTAF